MDEELTYIDLRCATPECRNYDLPVPVPDNGAESFCGVCGASLPGNLS
jgi:hypothetical protein